jgi:hypothetical protein
LVSVSTAVLVSASRSASAAVSPSASGETLAGSDTPAAGYASGPAEVAVSAAARGPAVAAAAVAAAAAAGLTCSTTTLPRAAQLKLVWVAFPSPPSAMVSVGALSPSLVREAETSCPVLSSSAKRGGRNIGRESPSVGSPGGQTSSSSSSSTSSWSGRMFTHCQAPGRPMRRQWR